MNDILRVIIEAFSGEPREIPKVYCKDCKYVKVNEDGSYDYNFGLKQIEGSTDPITGKISFHKCEPKIYNAFLCCSFYEK